MAEERNGFKPEQTRNVLALSAFLLSYGVVFGTIYTKVHGPLAADDPLNLSPGMEGNPYLWTQAIVLTPRLVITADKMMHTLDTIVEEKTNALLKDLYLRAHKVAITAADKAKELGTVMYSTREASIRGVDLIKKHMDIILQSLHQGSEVTTSWLKTIWDHSHTYKKIATFPFCYELSEEELRSIDAELRCRMHRNTPAPSLEDLDAELALRTIIDNLSTTLDRTKFAIYQQLNRHPTTGVPLSTTRKAIQNTIKHMERIPNTTKHSE